MFEQSGKDRANELRIVVTPFFNLAATMAFLDPSETRTHCPHKGDASYFSIITKSQTLENAPWSYEDPKEDVARIKGHIAFYPSDTVTVERV